MTSEVKNTYKGLKAFVPIAENPGKTEQLEPRVSAILAPDAMTALQKRSSHKPKAPAAPPAGGSQKSRLSGGGRRKKSAPAIEVRNQAYKAEIKTTHEMANEVTSILGPNVLGSLKASCHERKEQENQARPSKKTIMNADIDEDDGEVEEEIEGGSHHHARHRRRHRAGGKAASRSPAHRTGRIKPTDQRRTKSSDDVEKPGHKSPRRAKNHSRDNLRHKHQKDFANHAEDVGIDLEDGMDELFDEKDESPNRNEQHHKRPLRPQRARKPRRDHKSTSVGGASPGRRGRNGRRGGGTRMGNIKHEQMAAMTSGDQNKQFREEDVAEESEEEETPAHSEEEQENSEDGLLDDFHLADAATATAKVAVSAAGAAVTVAANTAGLAVGVAAGTVIGGGATVLGALGKATTGAASAATMSLRGGQVTETLDEYSDDEDDSQGPEGGAEDDATSGAWGFTEGGFAPTLK